MIKGKTPEEIRKLFNIVNDFTPEEEAQIKKENVSCARRAAQDTLLKLSFRNGQRTARWCCSVLFSFLLSNCVVACSVYYDQSQHLTAIE